MVSNLHDNTQAETRHPKKKKEKKKKRVSADDLHLRPGIPPRIRPPLRLGQLPRDLGVVALQDDGPLDPGPRGAPAREAGVDGGPRADVGPPQARRRPAAQWFVYLPPAQARAKVRPKPAACVRPFQPSVSLRHRVGPRAASRAR